MIGNCLYRSYKAAGWNAIGINHLGDWGTAFGKLVVMFRREFPGQGAEAGASLALADLNRMYVEFGHLAKEDDTLDDQARAAFAQMEEGDEPTLAIWKVFKDITLKELHSLYDLMNVQFDHYTGEAFFNEHLDGVLELLKDKNLLETSQERQVVMLEEEEMPPCLIQKSDGSSLYATRDIAAATYRNKEYDFDRCLYVVDNGQSLHFKQVFKVLEKCGFDWKDGMAHIPFGLILHYNEAEKKWSKGSSKMGNSNTLREVFEAASDKILTFIDEKNPELENKEEIATKIGIGALVFNDLKNKRLMDVKFDWDSALSFEGDTGPYVQNAHVRLCSILRKVGTTPDISKVDWSHFEDKSSKELILLLSHLQTKIIQVSETNEPYHLTQYSLNIAEAAHRFIHHNRVLGSEEQESRLFLVQCTQQVLENTLNLIGVAPIRFM
jgi:arginyl-tRNA synthetase